MWRDLDFHSLFPLFSRLGVVVPGDDWRLFEVHRQNFTSAMAISPRAAPRTNPPHTAWGNPWRNSDSVISFVLFICVTAWLTSCLSALGFIFDLADYF